MSFIDQKLSEGPLFTDFYQLTMAQLYFNAGLHEQTALFDHYFRSYPDYGQHKAGYCINAGLEWLFDSIDKFYFTEKEISVLRNYKNADGKNLFNDNFLKWLKNDFSPYMLNFRGIPEGRVIHPGTPINVVTGPIAVAQILETVILNRLNFHILIATKASRIKQVAKNSTIMEFGARRGHDTGVNAGVRAALIGGADSTSNVGISEELGIRAKGTHAHSMVQLYLALGMSEYDAFTEYANLYPDNCLFLVDTINTLESGIPNAIRVFENISAKGYKPVGIRLDSGDFAYLSIKAALMLNKAGFPDTSIVLSNELDELNIWQITSQIKEDAPKHGLDPDKVISRLVYGIGTRLITSNGHTALDGIFKLVAVNKENNWIPAIKISENQEKIPNPGNKYLYRIYKDNQSAGDFMALYDEKPATSDIIHLRHPSDHTKSKFILNDDNTVIESLHVDIIKNGKKVYDFPDINKIREIRDKDLIRLESGVKRIINPHKYQVSLSDKLFTEKTEVIKSLKNM